ncbi:hypothetical protein DBV15_01691 [Temnothorax longispinosus]|uniref:Uncharacterized protein n=1 Tax=Temnothorax longispinosus TaxID=300112 RepID=A0A4V3SCC7_9HYME|nr:hypothetical protein DBV15_01691 [Temnothorax longispinosus]
MGGEELLQTTTGTSLARRRRASSLLVWLNMRLSRSPYEERNKLQSPQRGTYTERTRGADFMDVEMWHYMKWFSLDIWLGKMNLKITLSIRLLDPPLLATCRVTLDLFTEICSPTGYMGTPSSRTYNAKKMLHARADLIFPFGEAPPFHETFGTGLWHRAIPHEIEGTEVRRRRRKRREEKKEIPKRTIDRIGMKGYPTLFRNPSGAPSNVCSCSYRIPYLLVDESNSYYHHCHYRGPDHHARAPRTRTVHTEKEVQRARYFRAQT